MPLPHTSQKPIVRHKVHSPSHASTRCTPVGPSPHAETISAQLVQLRHSLNNANSKALNWAAILVNIANLVAKIWGSANHLVLTAFQHDRLYSVLTQISRRLETVMAACRPNSVPNASTDPEDDATERMIQEVYQDCDPSWGILALEAAWANVSFAEEDWAEIVIGLSEFILHAWDACVFDALQCGAICKAVTTLSAPPGLPDDGQPNTLPAVPTFYPDAGFADFCVSRFQFIPRQITSMMGWLRGLYHDIQLLRHTHPELEVRPNIPSWAGDALLEMFTGYWSKMDIALTLPQEDCRALYAYCAELYQDNQGNKSTAGASHAKRCQFQLYREFNALCREYAHAVEIPIRLQHHWEVFMPFAVHLDRAVRQLPARSAVLFRGVPGSISRHQFHTGDIGAWGGGFGASVDWRQAVHLAAKDGTKLQPMEGTLLMILTNDGRSIDALSQFPEEQEFLHPLDSQYTMCDIVPKFILQTLSSNFKIVALLRVGYVLTLQTALQAWQALNFVYDDFLATYIPPLVKDHPLSAVASELMPNIQKFLASRNHFRTMLIAGKAGMGKTSCGLWLSHKVFALGYAWIFISLPVVQGLFSKGALAQHLQNMLGLVDDNIGELRRQRLVLVLDGLDEVERPPRYDEQSIWELNDFDLWEIHIIITCDEEAVHNYKRWLGDWQMALYLQGFPTGQQVEYVLKRLQLSQAPKPVVTSPREPREHRMTGTQSSTPVPLRRRSPRTMTKEDAASRQLVDRLQSSPIGKAAATPFQLMMMMDLYKADQLMSFQWESDLYAAWLQHKVGCQLQSTADTKGPKALAEVLHKAEELAWTLHCKGTTHSQVGDLGRYHWFRALPLRINDLEPDSWFSLQHISLQKFLVASHIFRSIQEAARMVPILTKVDLTRDLPTLISFGYLCQGSNSKLAHHTQRVLLDIVLASRTAAVLGKCAANAISLLHASGFDFLGLDLHGVRIPNAMLQGVNFGGINLSSADLKGVDLRGAILDYGDLRGADVIGCTVGELMYTLKVHHWSVTAVATSGDGSLMVSGSKDGTISLCSTLNGELLHSEKVHVDYITALAVFANGSMVASASGDQTVRIWDIAKGKLVLRQILKLHKSCVTCVATSADGTMIASGSYDAVIHIAELGSGKLLQTLEGHTDAVRAICVSADGSLLASGSKDETVRLWDPSAGTLLHILKGHSNWISSVAMSASGQIMVSGSEDKTLQVWNTATGERLHRIEAHGKPIRAVAMSADGSMIVSGSADNLVRTWSTSTGDPLQVMKGHSERITAVAISATGNVIVSGSWDGTARSWNAAPGGLVRTVESHNAEITAVVMSADAKVLTSGSKDGTVRVWNIPTEGLMWVLEADCGQVRHLAMSTDGGLIAAGYEGAGVHIWSTSTGQQLLLLAGHSQGTTALAISADGSIIASASYDGKAYLWDVATGKQERMLKAHRGYFTALAVSMDGSYICTGSADGTVRVWTSADGMLLRSLEGNGTPIKALAMSLDGGVLVAAANDKMVWVWNAWTGKPVYNPQAHSSHVTTLAMSADGTMFVSGSEDRVVRFWNSTTGDLMYTMEGHSDQVTSVAMSADGHIVASASKDKTIRLWDPSLGPYPRCVFRELTPLSMAVSAHKAQLSPFSPLFPKLQQYGAIQQPVR